MAHKNSTNTPVSEAMKLCGDHFEADCSKRSLGPSHVNLKLGSIPTKFCFVQEKTQSKLPAERKSAKQK